MNALLYTSQLNSKSLKAAFITIYRAWPVLVCPRFSNEKCVPNEFMGIYELSTNRVSSQTCIDSTVTVSLLELIMCLEAEWEKRVKKVLDNHHIFSLLVLGLCCFEVRYIFVTTGFSIEVTVNCNWRLNLKSDLIPVYMRQHISNYILNNCIYCAYTVPCCILCTFIYLINYFNNITVYLASQIGEFIANTFYSLFLDK